MHPGPGPLALVGSGEYLAVMAGVEGALIEGRPRRYVQIPTAAAPEGPDRLQYWLDLGAAQAERLGVQQVPVVVRDRDEAGSEDLAALIDGAGLVYLSGGNPQFLARTLRGTRVWAAIEAAWRSGAALAGCSAGAIALTDWVPAVRSPARAAEPGLGVLPWLRVLPHFDRMRSWAADLAARAAAGAPPGTTVIGIDEETAIVDLTGGGRSWQVHGRQQAWILAAGQDQETGQDQDTGPYPAGAIIKIDLYKSPLISCGACTRSMCSATPCAGGSSNCSPRAS
jgi:cyanophycinase